MSVRIVNSEVVAEHELRARIADEVARDRWVHGINLGLAMAAAHLSARGRPIPSDEVLSLGTREIATADIEWARALLLGEPK